MHSQSLHWADDSNTISSRTATFEFYPSHEGYAAGEPKVRFFLKKPLPKLPVTAFFDLHYTVADAEIDAQQHVHNLRYLQWTLWAARDHSATWGWDAAEKLELGIGWVVRSHEITYRAAALAGDEIIIRTWVSELGRVASRRRFVICRPADQTLLARGETRWALVDLNVRRAIEISPDIVSMIPVLAKSPPMPWDDINE